MDHMMPYMDGIEATNVIREMGYDHTIIALTANAVTGQAEIFMRNGFDGFIPKPVDSRELNEALNTHIRDKQPPGVIEAARKELLARLESAELAASARASFTASLETKKVFIKDAEKAIDVLETLLHEMDIKLYTTTVHGMKSALANLGENALSKAAGILEQAGRDQNKEIIKSGTQAFIDELYLLIDSIRPENEPIVTDISDQDKEYLHAQLLMVKQACDTLDIEAANEIIAELRKKAWTHDINDTLDKIFEYLLHSQLKKAAKVVENLTL
jgi:HPt (histidine-containing phosphotransfer) domain-containing protein